MTKSASVTRLVLYVVTTMLTAASAGLATVDFTDSKQIAAFAISIISTGAVTWRSYIDKSPSDIKPQSEQP